MYKIVDCVENDADYIVDRLVEYNKSQVPKSQAKDFYMKHGYELFGTLEDCPEGHCRYYLKKKC